ncbi:MAG: hypothetical protein JWN86_1410 [Planctomycetota bacterium]|nr:hypothetical protein [Planctomycetota bacterium]
MKTGMKTTTMRAGPPTLAGGEDKTADLDRLHGLVREAKHEDDIYLALMRKTAVHVYRCGRMLHEAQVLAKDLKVGWYSLLAEHEIAESTARQAIALFVQVTAAGYVEEDIQGKRITEAKVEFSVIKSPKQQEEARRIKEEERIKKEQEDRIKEEERIKKEEERIKEVDSGGNGGDGGVRNEPVSDPVGAPRSAGAEAQEDEGGGQTEEAEWGEILTSDLLICRQQQLHEESLLRWNEGRVHPYPEDYLLVLLDLGVLSVDDGRVRYLPDRGDDREELAAVLTDKLAPVLEPWTTPDDLMAALRSLIFAEDAGRARPDEADAGLGLVVLDEYPDGGDARPDAVEPKLGDAQVGNPPRKKSRPRRPEREQKS